MGAEWCRPERTPARFEVAGDKSLHEDTRGLQPSYSSAGNVPNATQPPYVQAVAATQGPSAAEPALGAWRHSEGGDITVTQFGRMVEIVHPYKPKQLLHGHKFVRGEEFYYFGSIGVIKGNRIVWDDGSSWTRRAEGAPKFIPPLPPDSEAPLALRCLRPTAPAARDAWVTIGVPSLARACGKWYFEVRLGDGIVRPQIGWASVDFQEGPESDVGVGDDEHSWSADGQSGQRCHGGGAGREAVLWPEKWRKGGIVGCAIDLEQGAIRFSYNGQWHEAAEFQIQATGTSFYPAVSAAGMFKFILTSSCFRCSPPDGSYEALLPASSDGEYNRPSSLEC